MAYDVFISFKNSDANGRTTVDSAIAKKLYDYLTDKGLAVFFSNEVLERVGKAQYTRVIDEALDSSKILIAVGCSHDNLNSQWVRYEWESFINDVRSGIKPNAEIFVLYGGMRTSDLPRALRQQQAFDANETASCEKLYNFVKNAMGIISVETTTQGATLVLSASEPPKPRDMSAEIPDGAEFFIPKGIASIIMTDGSEKRAIANSVLFAYPFEYDKRSYAEIENNERLLIADMKSLHFNQTSQGEEIITYLTITDTDGDVYENKQNRYQKIYFISLDGDSVEEVLFDAVHSIQFDWNSTPKMVCKYVVAELTDGTCYVSPANIFEFKYVDRAGTSFLTKLRLNNLEIPAKKIMSYEITELHVDTPPWRINLNVIKKNGTVISAETSNPEVLFLETAGLAVKRLSDFKRITFLPSNATNEIKTGSEAPRPEIEEEVFNRAGADQAAARDIPSNVNVGDTFLFGKYEWHVLAIEYGKALIITRDCIALKKIACNNNAAYRNFPYAGSNLREYLQGKFLDGFSVDEKNRISTTRIEEFGLTLYDEIFLLSTAEAKHYFKDENDRVADYNGQPAFWWLRSNGKNNFHFACVLSGAVFCKGHVNEEGVSINHSAPGGVRPALWLKLED